MVQFWAFSVSELLGEGELTESEEFWQICQCDVVLVVTTAWGAGSEEVLPTLSFIMQLLTPNPWTPVPPYPLVSLTCVGYRFSAGALQFQKQVWTTPWHFSADLTC